MHVHGAFGDGDAATWCGEAGVFGVEVVGAAREPVGPLPACRGLETCLACSGRARVVGGGEVGSVGLSTSARPAPRV